MSKRVVEAIWVCVLGMGGVAMAENGAKERHFEMTYVGIVEDVPAGAKIIDLWMPVPSDAASQTIEGVEILRPEGGEIDTEPKYGNKILHVRFEAPFDGHDLSAAIRFRAQTREVVVDGAKELVDSSLGEPGAKMAPYLGANSLISLDGKVPGIAAKIGLPEGQPVRAGRMMYDFMIENMDYNWRAEGAGEGNVAWVCDAMTGDCTDYNSLFLALCRLRGTPADHAFGFPVRSAKPEGKIMFYHCWARFWAPEVGWVPIDISEADKHPELTDYNFGSFAPNQVEFTHGRDVTLAPAQKGPPLNIFIFPYAEVDGAPHAGVKWTLDYVDLAGR